MKTYIQEVFNLQGNAGRADITPVGLEWTEHDGMRYSRHEVEIRDGGTYTRGFVTRVEGDKK